MRKLALLLSVVSVKTLFAQNFIITQPITVASGSGNFHPQLELNANNEPIVLWTDGNTKNLYFAKHNGSTTFLPPIQLNPAGIDVQTYNWSGADFSVENNNIYAVFKEDGYETGHIYMVKSTDHGNSFGDTVRVDALTTGYAQYPDIAVFQDTVWVTYMKHDAGSLNPRYVVSRSVDGGLSFETEVEASSLWTGEACYCCQPEIVVNNSHVVVYFRNNNSNVRDIKAVYSTDRGQTFTDTYSVDDHNWNTPSCPSVGPDVRILPNQHALSIYKTYVSGTQMLFMNQYDLSTGSQVNTIQIFSDEGTNNLISYPQLSVNQFGVVGMVWEAAGSGMDVYFNYTEDGVNGVQSSTAINLTDAAGGQTKPDIAVGDEKFHIVYADADGDVKYVELYALNGIHEMNLELVTVGPNPFEDMVQIQFHKLNEPWKISIYNLSGQLIYHENGTAPTTSIDLADKNTGVYFYNIQIGNQEVSGKIIHQ